MIPPSPDPEAPPLQLLSIVIPARDEEGCICATVEHLHLELRLQHGMPCWRLDVWAVQHATFSGAGYLHRNRFGITRHL